MSTKLYKKGDIVIVRPDIDASKRYNSVGINPYMSSLAGKEVTIKEKNSSNYYLVGHSFCWTDDMFVPVDEEMLLSSLLNKRINKKQYENSLKAIREREAHV